MKHQVIAMKKHPGDIELDLGLSKYQFKNYLPQGCTGILFCFESKKTARDFWGKDIILMEYETDNQTLNSDAKGFSD